MSSYRSVLAWMLAVNAVWAGKNFFVIVALQDMSPTTVGVLRWSGFALLLWIGIATPWFRKVMSVKMPKGRDARTAFAIGLLLFAPAHVGFYTALTRTTSIEGTVLHTTMPMVTAVLAALILREAVPRTRWFAILVSCLGAAVVAMRLGMAQGLSMDVAGNLLYLGAVIWESLGVVLIARAARQSSAVGALGYQSLGMSSGLLLATLTLPGDGGWNVQAWTATGIIALAYLIFLASAFCFCTWYTMVRRAPVSILMLVTGIQPLLAILPGWLFLGERVGPSYFVGAAMVLSALVIASREKPATVSVGSS